MYAVKGDFGASYICPWSRDTLEYDGLCSHPALQEGPAGDHDFTPEQLEAQAAEILERQAKKGLERSNRSRKRRQEEDPETFYTAKNKKEARYHENNPENSKKSRQNSVAKIKGTKKYYCEICDMAFGSPAHLASHNLTISHVSKAAAHHSSTLSFWSHFGPVLDPYSLPSLTNFIALLLHKHLEVTHEPTQLCRLLRPRQL